MQDLPILSIQQPWAWCIVNGYKPVENRSWATKIRGDILIHAGKKIDKEAFAFIREKFPLIPLPALNWFKHGGQTGGIVGKAKLIDCVDDYESDWFFGPYGFVLADATPLERIPMRGQLGFFKFPPQGGVQGAVTP